MSFRKALLLGLLASTFHAPVFAQDSAPAAEADPDLDESDVVEDEIVVTGQRERGAVIGDIEPEVQLNRAEIRSFGASNLGELLEAIAPQTSSGRGRDGGGPVVLLNGRRISGFSEIRGIPPEAIVRVDILPEEVALKYGYRADQRVVNFVLRPRFRAVTAELEAGMPTAGGRSSYEADVNVLRINDAGRMSLDLGLEHDTPLFESERNLIQPTADDMLLAPFRTLLGESDKASINATLNRTIFGNVSATGNARFEATSSQSGLGLAQALDGSFDALRPLDRESDGRTSHLGVALNGDLSRWRWSFTGNFDRAVNTSRTDTDDGARDRSKSANQSLGGELVANGTLVELPAGALSATFKAGAETRGFESETLRAGVAQARSLSRDRVEGQASFDLPIASRRRDILAGIGDLSANFNVAADHLSDFGTLTTLGYGLNWSPFDIVDVIASVTHEDGAPSVQQLGDPSTLTPNVRVFDFTRGETVDVARLDGGNPDLLADNRRVFKLGLTVKPLKKADLTLSANYTDSRTRNVDRLLPDRDPRDRGRLPGALRPRRQRAAGPDRQPADQFRPRRPRGSALGDQFLEADRPAGSAGRLRRRAARWRCGRLRTPGTPPTPGQGEGATAPSGERAQRGGGQWRRARLRRPGRRSWRLWRRRTRRAAPARALSHLAARGFDPDPRRRARARSAQWFGGRQSRRTPAARDRIPVGLHQERPRRARLGQLAGRHLGSRRHQRRRRLDRRSLLLRSRDGQPAPVRRSRPAARAGPRQSLAARHAGHFVGRQSVRQPARCPRRDRRDADRLSARSARPARPLGPPVGPQALLLS